MDSHRAPRFYQISAFFAAVMNLALTPNISRHFLQDVANAKFEERDSIGKSRIDLGKFTEKTLGGS